MCTIAVKLGEKLRPGVGVVLLLCFVNMEHLITPWPNKRTAFVLETCENCEKESDAFIFF